MKTKTNVRNWFGGWQWLKNSSGQEWSYTRIVGAICALVFQPAMLTYVYLNKDVKDITNMWQWLVIFIPALVSITLFGFEVIKENRALSIRIGDKEYGFEKEKEAE